MLFWIAGRSAMPLDLYLRSVLPAGSARLSRLLRPAVQAATVSMRPAAAKITRHLPKGTAALPLKSA